MNRLRIFLFVFAAAALVLTLALLARETITQQNLSSGVIIVSSYTLSEAYAGDLVVASSSITIEPGAQIAGSASLVGENVIFAGQISGDLTILAPQITLDGVQVGGRLHILADEVRLSGAIHGETLIDADALTIAADATFDADPAVCADRFSDLRAASRVAACPPSSVDPFANLRALRSAVQSGAPVSPVPALLPDILLIILALVGLTAFAPLVVTVQPARVARVARAMRRRPLHSALTGAALLALIAGLTGAEIVLLGTVSVIGLVALPVYVVALIGGLLLTGIGLIALALIIGIRLTGEGENEQPPIVAAAVGGLIVAAALLLIVLQPLGQAASIAAFIALSTVGAGAAIGTRLGASPSAAARLR
ncbi:MAG: hypothetical protein JNL42_05640 [Anaerolineae bacterium]|nr:hypothetical protein [Anaerolineae bacterium]